MKAVIFGASGQDGKYLETLLRSGNAEVTGIGRNDSTDITSFTAVESLVSSLRPDYIFHLAANSSTAHETLFENHAVISTGTLNILEAVKKYSPATKVFISGSGLQFLNRDEPIRESDPFEAKSAYAMSRIQSVYAARYYRTLGLKVYVGYFFNHDSPLRTERHMSRKIASFAQRVAAGSREIMEIGDLHAVKEYGFAGDIVKGIWTLVNQDRVMEANISTGKGYSIEDWLTVCFSKTGKNWKEHIAAAPGYTSSYRRLVSDPSLIFSLGWKPEVELDELAQMMMK